MLIRLLSLYVSIWSFKKYLFKAQTFLQGISYCLINYKINSIENLNFFLTLNIWESLKRAIDNFVSCNIKKNCNTILENAV